MIRVLGWSVAPSLLSRLAVPRAASSQSVIAGQVKDESGAVMPGVTVEVTLAFMPKIPRKS